MSKDWALMENHLAIEMSHLFRNIIEKVVIPMQPMSELFSL